MAAKIIDLGEVVGKAGKDGVGTPAGGATGDVMAKISDTDYDFGWLSGITSDHAKLQNLAYANSGHTGFASAQDIADLAKDIQAIKDALAGGGGGGSGSSGTGMFPDTGAGGHNSIYRGKYLGDAATDAQYSAIAAGTFDELYIGDYWTIDGVNYRIAAFDYFYNCGDTNCTTHHTVIVPDKILYSAVMNGSHTTSGGYYGSAMRTSNLAQAANTIKSAFSGHVLKHREVLTSGVSGDKATGWSWYDSEVELMNEVMLYGSGAWGQSSYGNGFNVATGNGQFPLFFYRHDLIHNRQDYWLRDVVSSTDFALVSWAGYANHNTAGYSLGVRPAFLIF